MCFFSVLCLLCLCARLFICALWSPAGKGLTYWLSIVVSNSEFVTFPNISWVRCGTWLYRFLIFAPLLTLEMKQTKLKCLKIKTNRLKVTKNIIYYASMTKTKSKWGRIWVKRINYQETDNENEHNHINSAPSNQNQIHRRDPVFIEVNNDKKNYWQNEELKQCYENVVNCKHFSRWLKLNPRY